MCLDALYPQAAAAGAEVLVCDGHGAGLPGEAAACYPGVARLPMPGASVLQMRARAMAQAAGDVVAVTEDHCRVTPDWCRRILDAHAAHPEAAVIGGAVENGSDRRVIHWASFFIVNGAAMPPVADGPQRAVAGQATVSYKREVVPRDVPDRGRMEWMLNAQLRAQGRTLWTDGRILVAHDQPLTFAEACAIHFHDSRIIAGFRLESLSPVEWAVRVAACAAMPPLLFLRTVLPILAKRRHLGWLARSVPMIGVLVTCRAAGALAGLFRGPGDSPLRIR